jgi:hypothetical protein
MLREHLRLGYRGGLFVNEFGTWSKDLTDADADGADREDMANYAQNWGTGEPTGRTSGPVLQTNGRKIVR